MDQKRQKYLTERVVKSSKPLPTEGQLASPRGVGIMAIGWFFLYRKQKPDNGTEGETRVTESMLISCSGHPPVRWQTPSLGTSGSAHALEFISKAVWFRLRADMRGFLILTQIAIRLVNIIDRKVCGLN